MTQRTGAARAWVAAWLAVGVLQACGGGGGGGETPPPPPPPPPPPAPTITAQPADVYVLQDGTANFTVTAANATTYEWQQSTDDTNWTDVDGGTAATLAAVEPLAANGLHYRVIVSGAGGHVTSGEAALTVMPMMALEPASLSTYAGQDAQFNAGPTYDLADASLQWQESVDGQAWTDIGGATAQVLVLPAVALADSGLHVRLVVTAFGHVYTSDTATLTVTPNPSDPVFVVQPLDATVPAGGDARFSAWVQGGDPAQSYQWQTSTDGGAHWNDVAGAHLQTLLVSGVDAGADGEQVRLQFTANGRAWPSQAATLHVGTAGAGRLDLLAGVTGGAGDLDDTGTAAWLRGPGSPGFDAQGNLYFLDGVRFKRLDAAGRVTSLAGRTSSGGYVDGVGAVALLNGQSGSATVVASTGDIFVLEADNNLIRRVTADGTVSTFAGGYQPGAVDGSGSAAGFRNPQGLAIDASDNLYVADTGNHTIRRVTPAGKVTTIAGTAGVSGSTDGTAGVALLNSPAGIAVDGHGVVSFTDAGNTVRQWSAANGVTTLAGTAGTSGSTDATGAAARFDTPLGLAVDSHRTLYVADVGNKTIRKITAAGVVSTYAGTAGVAGYVDATGGAALFTWPYAVAAAPDGSLAVADDGVLRRIGTDRAVTTLAGRIETQGQADGVGAQATFDLPRSMTTDAAGNVYVGDGHGILRRIGRDGATSTYASGGFADGVVLDDAGNFIVASGTFDCVIRRVSPLGVANVLAGDSSQCTVADGSGTNARFDWPHAIARAPDGGYYVLDRSNLRRISPSGEVTTLTPTGSSSNCTDIEGPLSNLDFCAGAGLVVDEAGNVFIANGRLVQRVDGVTHQVTVFAGSETTYGWSSLDGTGTGATFGLLAGITRDAAGNLYVADMIGSNVRRIDPAGHVTTLFGRAGLDGIVLGTAPALYRPMALAMMDATHLAVASEDTVLVYTLPGGTPLARAASARRAPAAHASPGSTKAKVH
jgi:sugar lactone lactonase YvrE